MKKLILILLCLPLLFSTCKKEDEEPTNAGNNNNNTGNTTATIIGTWEFASYTSTQTEGYVYPIQGTEIITSTETTSSDTFEGGETLFWDFASDGTHTETIYANGILDGIYTSNYLKHGNSLSIGLDDLGDVGLTYIITTLTNSTLIMDYSDYYENTWNDTTYFEHNTGSLTWNKSNKKMDSSIQTQNKTGKTPFFKQFIDRRKE